MRYRLILLEYKIYRCKFLVFRKIFIVINGIYNFEFAANFDIFLHFAYNFSQRYFVKGGGRFFFKNLCIPDIVTPFLLTYLI